MVPSQKLLSFFRTELEVEERTGFSHLKRIPDSHVQANLACYASLSAEDKASFADMCAYWAHACYGFVIGVPQIDHTKHPFFDRWRHAHWGRPELDRSVPILRTAVSQYKVDRYRGVASSRSEELFSLASSVRSIKAPELRKRVRTALKKLGYHKQDGSRFYCGTGMAKTSRCTWTSVVALPSFAIAWPWLGLERR